MRTRVPASAALAIVLSLGLLGVAACAGRSTKRFIPPPPPTVSQITTAPPGTDFSGVALQSVGGKTPPVSVQITGGPATLGGVVTGPDGPVGGATVRLERFVGDASAKLDITTNGDGSWKAPQPPAPPTIPTIATASTFPGQITIPTTVPTTVATTAPRGPQGILGGRYRVRAWRAPDLALTTPQIIFVEAKPNQIVSLPLSRYQGVSASSIISPDPPVLNAPFSLTVIVTTASVNPEGVVSAVPLPNAAIQLSVGPSLLFSSGPSITNVQGRATFQVRCQSIGPNSADVTINGTQTFSLTVKPCAAPPSTTTLLPPDGGSSTSSSIGGGGGSTTTRRTTSVP